MTVRAWAKAAPDKNSTAAVNNSERITLLGVETPPLRRKFHVPRRRARSGFGSRTHNATSQVSPTKFPFQLSPEFISSSSESFSAFLHAVFACQACITAFASYKRLVPYRTVKLSHFYSRDYVRCRARILCLFSHRRLSWLSHDLANVFQIPVHVRL